MQERAAFDSHKMLFLNTLAFAICFAAWMLNGVLVTFLSTNQVFKWGPVEIGWLMGIPVLTGALFRLPAGMLTDKFGGKPVFGTLLILSAVPMYLLSTANSFTSFALYSFGFGLTGASFAIGIAYTSLWYPKNLQGTVLGIFGAGNMGAALTTFFAPGLLNSLTNNATNLEGWRMLPKCYAALLLGMGIIFFIFAINKKSQSRAKSVSAMLEPLANVRVWRFGLYYSLFFGSFVAFSQWLLNYFVSAYYLPLVTAGFLTTCFSLPTGAVRTIGGWMSDLWGARTVMYWVLGASITFSFLLIVPKMEIFSPGQGVVSTKAGVVTGIDNNQILIGDKKYSYMPKPSQIENFDDKLLVFPTKTLWQEPVVKVGQKVQRKELLARGVTRIYFQANVWIFTLFVFILGAVLGVGCAAVFKHIPTYFPEEVGVVGGIVGVLGGLGGFICPLIFGYLLEYTGLWTSCWMLTLGLSILCLWCMHHVVVYMTNKSNPELKNQFSQ